MRILVVAPEYPSLRNKYQYAFVHARCKIYKKYGNTVAVWIPNKASDKYDYEGIPVFKGRLQALSLFVNGFDPDIIAIHVPSSKWISSLKQNGRPIVVWIHGAEVLLSSFHHYIAPFGTGNALRKLLRIPYESFRNLRLRKSIMQADAIIYVSGWMRRMSERYLLTRHPRSFVIPNPIDTELFKPTESHRRGAELSLVSVRALEWKYGLDVAIKAIGGEKKMHLTIVGTGTLRKYLESLARTCHSNLTIITEGIQHNKLPGFYNRFMFFVAPSRTEAQGVAMCEAMACGLPVIATCVGGIPEFVVDGYNGFLVPPNDSSNLRRVILKASRLDDALYHTFSENARAFAVGGLSHDVIFNKELEAFKSARANAEFVRT